MPELSCQQLKYMKEFHVRWPRFERMTFRESPSGPRRVVDDEVRASMTGLTVRFSVPTLPLLVEHKGVNPDLFMLKVQLALEVAMQSVYDGKELWVVEREKNAVPTKRAASSLILED